MCIPLLSVILAYIFLLMKHFQSQVLSSNAGKKK